MAKRSKSKTKQREASHAPEATEANKKAIIEALGAGLSPGEAAEAVKVGRSTVYSWKRDDPSFGAAWEEAVAVSLDRVEGKLYSIAMAGKGDRQACMDILKSRRGSEWNNGNANGDRVSNSQTNYFLNVPMQEHIERLERLGLPVPVIESDREEDYAPDDANRS